MSNTLQSPSHQGAVSFAHPPHLLGRAGVLALWLAFTTLGLVGCEKSPQADRADQPAPANASPAAVAGWTPIAGKNELTESQTAQYQRAVAARLELMKNLMAELVQALAQHGTPGAIEVCKSKAVKIAEGAGEAHGVAIGRTSARLRNGHNRPPAWGVDAVKANKNREHFCVHEDGRLGVMSPILTSGTCLRCHGPEDRIDPAVKETLAANYPGDRATGFKKGEIRGWLWVEVPAGE